MEAIRHADYSMASSTLNTALLASVGEKNRNHLKTTFPALKLYMLSPREIVDTMRAKHGVATSDDVSKLQDPLSQALTSLSDLTGHMDFFLLASQRQNDTERPRGNRLQVFRVLSRNCVGLPLCAG
jgi:hypothetical protein